jgi:hypothetical protein
VILKRFQIAAGSSRFLCLLALFLLIGQIAAQAHVYSHLDAKAPRSDFTGSAGQLCSECLSSAPLLSAAGAPASPFVALVATVATPIAAPVLTRVHVARHYAFRSRAPPELL